MNQIEIIPPAFKSGDKVEVLDRGVWRPAIIESVTAGNSRYSTGYYIRWSDIPERKNSYEPMPSTGGWTMDRCVRAVS